MEELRNKLLSQGLGEALVDSMLKSFKPKKDKTPKKNAFFAGQSKSKKVDKTITAITRCQTCGSSFSQQIIIKATSVDSPDVQKLACSVCVNCPTFIRQFTHEELVTILLLAQKPQIELHSGSIKFLGSLAKMLTPETAVTFTSLSDMEREVKNASNSKTGN